MKRALAAAPRRRLRRDAALVLGLLAIAGCDGASGPRSKAGVVLVTIDTLPADRIACYGAPNVRTPEIDRLARAGILVRDAISPAPLTLPSHCTILSGLDPPDHGVRDNGLFALPDSVTTVPELLPRGVKSGAAIGAVPLAKRFNLSQGFDFYDQAFPEDRDRSRPPERKARQSFDAASTWWNDSAAGTTPFLWAHVFDPHYPYEAPRPWNRVARALAGAGPYEAEVAYTDRELGRFLRRIDAAERDRASTVVVTADHGEALGAHREITHSIFVYDATQRVPLILAGPDIEPRIESAQRGLAEVAPTLLALFGVDAPDELESDLFSPPLRERAWVETMEPELLRGWSALFGARTPEWKYIRAPRPELYDLVADPGETRNLWGERSGIRDSLAEWVEGRLALAVPTVVVSMDDRMAEQLRSLGYIATVEPGSTPDLDKDPKDGIDAIVAAFHGAQAFLDGRLRVAERQLLRAIELDPEGKEAHSYLAATYVTLGRYDLAVDYANRSLELPPHFGEVPVRITAAQAHLGIGQPDRALFHLRVAETMDPDHADLPGLIAQAQGDSR